MQVFFITTAVRFCSVSWLVVLIIWKLAFSDIFTLPCLSMTSFSDLLSSKSEVLKVEI